VSDITQVRRLGDSTAFAAHLRTIGADIGFDDEVEVGDESPLSQPLSVCGRIAANRFAILPMEGWDGTDDGRPTDLVRRRWRRFGASGAGLVWGGEAVAVTREGRANPNQLVLDAATVDDLAHLRAELVGEHERIHGAAEQLVVGLQLTHSGRFARPDGRPRPRTAYAHPLLDRRVGADDTSVLTDPELDEIAGRFIEAAALAATAGFDFVDVKHCHGYLGHDLLSAVDRPGAYGGDLERRTRFLRGIVTGIAERVPGLGVGIRLSAFDLAPFVTGPDGRGTPEVDESGYRYAFGGDGTGLGVDLAEPDALLDILGRLGVALVCITAGSPYYCPHAQRPAYHPPSDGYQPPNDPLLDVARLLAVTAELKRRHPGLVVVGSGYSYLQEWLPNVAQYQVRTGNVDVVGIGRMALTYPELCADVLAGRELDRRRVCRTFSDCTTAPRNGLVSGCYPLDEFYKNRPDRRRLAAVKREVRRR
jgi:2,4-dienoyl-CoA reductase-like NADH-dependent reductase (Old Yellow Enzyme family)